MALGIRKTASREADPCQLSRCKMRATTENWASDAETLFVIN